MRVISCKNYEQMSKIAAGFIKTLVQAKPEAVLGLATGSTPEGLYKELVSAYQNGELDFSQVHTVNLDEYEGLGPQHEQSYRYFMNDKLFKHINVKEENTYVPDGLAKNIEAMLADYEALIDSFGGVDLQLLGLGHDGHIGFNEPCDHFEQKTHRVKLNSITLEANKRFFANIDEVPKYAYTQGIGSIMKAKQIVMIVSGADKKEILHKVLYGPVCPEVPASILQFHKNVIVIADEKALA